MRHYLWCSGPLLMGAALLFVVPFELPPNPHFALSRQAAESSEIRWEFDTGG